MPGGGVGGGGQLVSDWTKMQDGRWVIGQAAIWLDNNSRWQMKQDWAE